MADQPIISSEDIENRVGATAFRRLLDEDNDGNPDQSAVDQLIQDAESEMRAHLPTSYVIPAPTPKYLKKLTLDVAQALLFTRHPEFLREDGVTLMKLAITSLEKYVAQQTKVPQVTREDAFASVVSSSGRDETGWVR